MATYYRWDQNQLSNVEKTRYYSEGELIYTGSAGYVYYSTNKPTWNGSYYAASDSWPNAWPSGDGYIGTNYWAFNNKTPTTYYYGGLTKDGNNYFADNGITNYYRTISAGKFVGYVYSLTSSTYPTNGQSGSYWYNNRTTVTSPTNPSQISYPSTINTLSTTITWQASTSNTSYPVSRYELSYSTNGGSSWQVAGTTAETSYQFGISSPEVTQIQFRVRAMDTNSQYSDYVTGTNSTVQYVPANPPVLVLPDNAKLGETITISWNSVTDATNYILQRKVDGSEWTQIYSGSNLSTTNLIDNLGISYRIAFNVGSNFTSDWSQEYRLNTYEKFIEMTYLGDDGNYMPLYPRTISNAVVNASDLMSIVSLSGTYQGNGLDSNSILLSKSTNDVEPKIAFISDDNGETTIVNTFDNGSLVVSTDNNVSGKEYSYVVIGEHKKQ